MSKEIAEEYASSLADLTVNSKPLINMLTILAEENIDHAGVIVETVEKHLEKVHPDIKLPVLYLVDSIIKNVGRAYTQKFAQSIVNMFTRTFKQVDEKVRSQMFKLRETWHDVFPATKLYQLDVKVNLIDPAWPIQAQPQQSNIHPVATTSTTPVVVEEEEKMRSIVAKKEQELLMLQRKKIEMELEQARRQLELTEKTSKTVTTIVPPPAAPAIPLAMVNPVVAAPAPAAEAPAVSVKARLGPPVNKLGRIAPVSGALASARRDPRLARRPAPAPAAPIAPNVFDIKPLDHVTKRKNVITIDVQPDAVRGAPRDPRDPRGRRDPRLEPRPERARRDKPRPPRIERPKASPPAPPPAVDEYLGGLPDPKKITKLPPIPKINRDGAGSPAKKRKEEINQPNKLDKKQRRDLPVASPDKKARGKDRERKKRRERAEPLRERTEPEPATEPELVAFKELKNYHRERYMRRNRDKSPSPVPAPAPEPKEPDAAPKEPDAANAPENKDVDLRVLPVAEVKPATVAQKRSSTELLEGKSKKSKNDKFDILFGNEDVDLRQLPQVEEAVAPPPPSLNDSPKANNIDEEVETPESPKQKEKDWNEVKEKKETKKSLSSLDLVRAKLAEATKSKDGLGRPLLFSKSPSVERERRRTISAEDIDLRTEKTDDFDAENHKKTISIIMSQAKEQYSDGQLDKNQYNTLMYQVLRLYEEVKLKEAKQRESLEESKRKLKAHVQEENQKVSSPKSSPTERNRFGDIDERVPPVPPMFMDTPPDSQQMLQDSDMRMNPIMDTVDGQTKNPLLPLPPMMPMFPPFPPWRGQPRPRGDEYVPRRFRGAAPPFFRGKFDKRAARAPFEPRMAIAPLPMPKMGMCQGDCPLARYERSSSPPPLGAPGPTVPPTDYRILEYIDQDPVKTIQIDGIPREIRFYGETAVIMMDWDDPREIKFLPGCRRVTFDNKDSVVLAFEDSYKRVEIDDQVFDIRFGRPTRELYINGRWHECYFGGQPLGVIIDGKPRLVHLEGPLPQVDIGKIKRTDLVAGKINLIVNATQICSVYLDAKVQKFQVNGQFFTIRFVDALRTVLINEQPFQVEYGDMPKPILLGNEKCFVRFSALPRYIKPGHVQIANMEGSLMSMPPSMPVVGFENIHDQNSMEIDQDIRQRPIKTPSPDMMEHQRLDMLASVMPMPDSMTPASASEYSVAEPFFSKTDKIPGLETSVDEKPSAMPPVLTDININVNDLFAKLVATGIVQVKNDTKEEVNEPKNEVKNKPREDKSVIHRVDLLKPETLKVKQPLLVAKLYGGMQCSGCGARFPPEHTVRYSQHLDWHFRQNRRERDSARRAHSRHWHYDLSDWVQYEEVEDLEEREKSWFETGGGAGAEASEAEEAPPSAGGAAAGCRCALCGDAFQQFYNEDKEEWHLRNAVKHEDNYYHPLCFEDYKASLTKEEPVQEIVEDSAIEEKTEVEEELEPIEIKEDDVNSQSDTESVVEVVEEETEVPEPVEIDEGEEDDVVFKAEPVEQVLVDDEADTDDETAALRASRDEQAKADFASVKVKLEPIDPDDEPIITAEEDSIPTTIIDTTSITVLSSIDGNVQLSAPVAAATTNIGIRINITKPIPTTTTTSSSNNFDDSLDDISVDDEPLPPGEEPELEYEVKPAIQGKQLSRQPPIQRGSELSGLCSIM